MNVPHLLATQLSNPTPLSTEQKLFREALDNVEQRTCRTGRRPPFFDILHHAQTVGDLNYALESARKSNKFWSVDVGKSWFKNLSKFAESILVYKGVIDSVTSRIGANVASPIWGTLAFVLGLFKDISSTSSKLENAESALKYSIQRFARYFSNGNNLSSDVHGALINYYEVVISFAVQTHEEFQASRSLSTFNAVHKSLDNKLVELNEKIYHAIDHVDKGAYLDRFDTLQNQVKTLNGTISLAMIQQVSSHSSTQPPVTRSIHNLPKPNRNFSGRKGYLSSIWKAFQRQSSGQASVAVYGMGGIGKTQLLQRYAHDQLHENHRRVAVYIDASNPTSIRTDVLAFMQTHAADLLLNVSSDSQTYGHLHAWLSKQNHWLLLLDNVQDLDDVRKIFPRGYDGQVLCSTRHKLLAKQLANEDAVEVMPMTDEESESLVGKLAQSSTFDEDKTRETHDLVTRFAKGIPLLIEQLIHNAIFSQRSIKATLSQVIGKTALLRQKNLSSLHEDNLSLGGVIMQAFETIRDRSDKAEALFSILAYFEPSAIPIQLIREGSSQYQSFLAKPYTYDRGARYIIDGTPQVPTDNEFINALEQASSSKAKPFSWRRPWSSKLRRGKPNLKKVDLPVDDEDARKALIKTCGPGTPVGRLFENTDNIDDALLTLCNAAVVRYTSLDTLWMHDLVSEVARAVIESESDTFDQHCLLIASTMVYLSFPHPQTLYDSSNLHASNRHLPHALTCHKALKCAEILNDSSIDPELSHLIGSTLLNNLTREFQVSGEHRTREEMKPYDDRILEFYMQAYHGYRAGWARLKSHHAVTDEQIRIATIRDRDKEVGRNCLFNGQGYSREPNRYGRSAPWRAIQTAARLFEHLEQNMERYPEAKYWLQIVLDFCEAVFGLLDEETHHFRLCMITLSGRCDDDFQSAYNFTLKPVAQMLGCRISALDHDRLKTIDFSPVSQAKYGSAYIATAGYCALDQARVCRDRDDQQGKVRWAETALVWFGFRLQETQAFYGNILYVLSSEMKDHAYAYELCEKPRESMYHFAQAVVCTFDTTGPVSELCTPAPSTKFENIKIYEDAKIRLYDESAVSNLTAWNDDPELKELIGLCDVKAKVWKDTYEPSVQIEAEKVDWDAVLAQPWDYEEHGSVGRSQSEDRCRERQRNCRTGG